MSKKGEGQEEVERTVKIRKCIEIVTECLQLNGIDASTGINAVAHLIAMSFAPICSREEFSETLDDIMVLYDIYKMKLTYEQTSSNKC